MRRHLGQRAYTRPIMITEYQDKFLPPRCYTAPVLGAKNKHLPYQQQLKAVKTNKEENGIRGNSGEDNERTLEMPSFRSVSMAQKRGNHPTKLPPVTNSNPMSTKKSCAQFCPECTKEAKEENLTTYKRDYQVWKFSKRQPYRLHDSLKGVGTEDLDSKERQPIEGTTSYKSSFIPHPLQPRKSQNKLRFQTSSFQLGQTTPTHCSHCKGTLNRARTAGKDGMYNVDRFHTTMQADFTEHKLPRKKPVIPARQTKEISKEPFEGTTTMRDDYRRWDLPRRPLKDTKKDCRKSSDQISFSVNSSEGNHCQRCHAISKDSDKRVDNGSAQFERMTAGTTRYLPQSANGVTTWMKCNTDKDQAQMVSRVVSARN